MSLPLRLQGMIKNERLRCLALAWALTYAPLAHAEPDEKALGKAESYPRGASIVTMYADPFKVGSFSATDKILPTRMVAQSDSVTALRKAVPATITYQYKGETYQLSDYLERQRVTSLLVLRNGEIIAERYRYGRQENDHFLSFSMAKSVTSMLIAVALQKGLIKSLDDRAEDYVPELKGSGYGVATLRQLLRMSSGVKFREKYDGKDDLAKLRMAQRGAQPDGVLKSLASFNDRKAEPGEKFSYASSESTVLGYVLARATGRSVASLTSKWLWQPLGAEADAWWNLSAADKQEETAGYFNATLRDYGRIGLMLADDGAINGRQIVPKDYLLEATTAERQPQAFRPGNATKYYGYGYQFWLFPLRHRTFGIIGIYGQCIFVQPDSGLVMVQTAVNKEPSDAETGRERDALWRGVLSSLGGHLEP